MIELNSKNGLRKLQKLSKRRLKKQFGGMYGEVFSSPFPDVILAQVRSLGVKMVISVSDTSNLRQTKDS